MSAPGQYSNHNAKLVGLIWKRDGNGHPIDLDHPLAFYEIFYEDPGPGLTLGIYDAMITEMIQARDSLKAANERP